MTRMTKHLVASLQPAGDWRTAVDGKWLTLGQPLPSPSQWHSRAHARWRQKRHVPYPVRFSDPTCQP